MRKVTEAEAYLLSRIRQGDESAWEQFVGRYRGRLLAFAQSKLRRRADAEDIVQDTFVGFLMGLADYRGDAAPETYLFTILRRKIINTYRSAHAKHICLLQDVCQGPVDDEDSEDYEPIGTEPTASFYVRREEQSETLADVLAEALESLVNNYKSSLKFREMEIIELLFYSQLSNKEVGAQVSTNEKNIAVIKHRCLKQVREYVAECEVDVDDEANLESLLTEVWESRRLSCPKRSTIGAFLLGTLDDDWQAYVDFHLHRLGCHFCRANFDDLKRQTEQDEMREVQQRIMESTIGFLRKAD